jgi:hypothetical protein
MRTCTEMRTLPIPGANYCVFQECSLLRPRDLFDRHERLRLTQPPVQWVPAVKRPGCEADHSPPSSAKPRNA